jgi:hypothetical protein
MGYWDDAAKKAQKKKGKSGGLFTRRTEPQDQPGYKSKVNRMGPKGGGGGVTGPAAIKPMSKAEEDRLIKEMKRRERKMNKQ